jgi:sec-independent protein translocase protein TatB
MFNLGAGEIIGLFIIGVILVGPDRLPTLAADAAKLLYKIKRIAQSTTNELKSNLGPGYEDLQVKDLNPKTFIKKHIGDVIDKNDFEIKPKPKIDPDLL